MSIRNSSKTNNFRQTHNTFLTGKYESTENRDSIRNRLELYGMVYYYFELPTRFIRKTMRERETIMVY